MKPISRKDAKATGSVHYWTGKPCKRGHIDKRYVASSMCATCSRDAANKIYAALSVEDRRALQTSKRDYYLAWCKDNRSKQADIRRRHKLRNPDYFKNLYAKNREHRKRESSAWYHANAGRALQRQREYATKHIERDRPKRRLSANKRRAIKARVFVEVVDPQKVFTRDKGMCGICAFPVDPMSPWEVDHVIPISQGGVHGYANVQLSHRTCNRSKGGKVLT